VFRGRILVLAMLAGLGAASSLHAAAPEHFVPAMNRICREASALADARFNKLARPPQVDTDLSRSRMTPTVMRYLRKFADIALTFSRPAFRRAQAVDIVAADESMRTTYLAANAQMLDVLAKLRAATARGDAKQSTAFFRRTLDASARISKLDARYNLTDCGSS
jgi:hypothetical protein